MTGSAFAMDVVVACVSLLKRRRFGGGRAPNSLGWEACGLISSFCFCVLFSSVLEGFFVAFCRFWGSFWRPQGGVFLGFVLIKKHLFVKRWYLRFCSHL